MRFAILSDIHGNLEAMTSVMEKCAKLEIDKYIFLGDVVGYNGNPKECMDIVRGLNIAGAVKGNHDEYAANNDDVLASFNPHAKAAVLWTKSQLSLDDRSWLTNLPMRQVVKGTFITIVHATLDSPEAWGYIFDEHHAADNFAYQFTQLCFCGHSHVPVGFCKKSVVAPNAKAIEELKTWTDPIQPDELRDFTVSDSVSIDLQTGCKYLLNVGSIGQPRNKDPRASFAVYDSSAKNVTRFRVPYDIASTQARIREVGLPERLAARLSSGT
ncbi:MAG: metallophosphoesterase family protein [Lentisphaeria bacterium]|nr:metallophosphoesterase family protein [Lentisphaeria bacterium]